VLPRFPGADHFTNGGPCDLVMYTVSGPLFWSKKARTGTPDLGDSVRPTRIKEMESRKQAGALQPSSRLLRYGPIGSHACLLSQKKKGS
jgi:hypothetical protein